VAARRANSVQYKGGIAIMETTNIKAEDVNLASAEKENVFLKKFEGAIRSTVLIDPRGLIRHRRPKANTKGHAAYVLTENWGDRELRASTKICLKYGRI
jgi:alkyl hydroperoxide reductase subunit AhpC